MPGDISREPFRQPKHYSGVRGQQGRVQVESEQNEQLAIAAHRTETEAIDVIGPCGVPEATDGFRVGVTDDGTDLTVSPGRIYVDGILCELEGSEVPITFPPNTTDRVQLDSIVIDDRPLEAGDWVQISGTGVSPQASRQFRIVLIDAKLPVLTLAGNLAAFQASSAPMLRRVVTYASQPDDPKPKFVKSLTSPPLSPSQAGGRLSLDDGAYIAYLDVWKREITALDDPHIREVALGGPDTTTRLKNVWQLGLLPLAIVSPSVVACDTQFPEWDALVKPPTALMNARTQPGDDTKNPCQLPPSAGFQRLENQTYRVQVQNSQSTPPTIKWSRESASVETTIENIAGSVVTVTSTGKDDVLGFAGGQWVEIVDDESELKSFARPLLQIDSVKPATREITLKGAVPALAGRPGLKLRRWDQSGNSATQDGVAITNDWQDLEGGVQVRFSAGTFRSGDFWIIPARTATAEIDWPPFAVPNTNPVAQPPLGTAHHFCRLAIVTVIQGVLQPNDCRKLFPPLTELPGPEPGMHIQQIVSINANGAASRLVNDSNVALSEFNGIEAICDNPVAPITITRPTCFVTVELPAFQNPRTAAGRGLTFSGAANQPASIYLPVFLPATVSAANNVISWRLTADAVQALQDFEVPAGDRGILARFTLKGNFIWSAKNPKLFLDGDLFGFREANVSNLSARLPSGDQRRGGDFETWFWLTQPEAPPAFTLNVAVAAPTILRGEGLTELVTDILLTGTGGTPTSAGVQVPEYNVSLQFNAPVTNLAPNALSDAVLLMNDPASPNQNVSLNTIRFGNPTPPPVLGVGGAGINYRDGSAPNIFEGRLTAQNTIVFTGVPIDPPGPGQRVFRIKNVRLSANSLSGGGAASTAIVNVSLTGAPAIPLSNPQANVGFVTSGLVYSLLSPAGTPGPVHIPFGPLNITLLTGGAAPAQTNFLLSYREGFASAFKIRKGASTNPFVAHPEQESGYDNTGADALPVAAGAPLPPNIGAASSGTRFRASFRGIPGFIRVFLTTRDVPAGNLSTPDKPLAKAILVSLNGAPVPGSRSPGGVPLGTGLTTGNVPVIELQMTAGAGIAEWEFVSSDPAAPLNIETLVFGVALASRNTDNVNTAPMVGGTLSPLPITATALAPQFVDATVNQPSFLIP